MSASEAVNADYLTGTEGRIAWGRCSRSSRGACAGIDPSELSHVISPWFEVAADAFQNFFAGYFQLLSTGEW